MVNWYWRTFQALMPDELYAILALRQAVFIVEQQCAYCDMDFHDQQALHLLAMENKQLLAYLRLLPVNTAYRDALSFGRVVTAPDARARGLGKQLILHTLDFLEQQGNHYPIIISAQLYLKKFYESFQFTAVGEPYQEDNIPHIQMIRALYETEKK